MNNAKLWLVVKPTVGIPVFLGAVAVGSFAVHVAVVSQTSWYNDYLTGQPLGSGDQAAAAAMVAPEEAAASYATTLDLGDQAILASADVLTPPVVE
ncbi:Light-harvesting LHII, alpha subunit A [Roseibacterium elongatum DSM 19469]|uniref:Antenna pigment protein alpha chain n=1 Tax=Roseicyclus elongatus DSM 19469 TaxID=1294273 RepID=W8RNR1_9RHOB|nr:light-harvesting protein [Roseibacterium elongatum]AHM02789.1 Light-harvesting LHII, alpha subunit A [Roseibacterium elongatum DSM 19469]